MHSKPVPRNPYNPLSPLDTPSQNSSGSGSVRYPSPFVPIRLPVFAPVLWINDRVVSLLSVGGGKSRRYAQGAGMSVNGGRRRGLSDSTVESVEEGSADAVDAGATFATARGQAALGGLGRSGRRKAD